MQISPVELCVINDGGYSVPLMVMLTSAKLNKRPESHYRVHCLFDSVDETFMAKFRELASPDFELCFHACSAKKFEGVAVRNHVPVSALLKFDIPTILPDIDKVLYIDGDTIIRSDLSQLFGTDLNKAALGAVRDIAGELVQHFGQAIGVERYFNSGVLLMNLALFREENAGEQLFERQLHSPENWICHDQDNFNTYFTNRIMELPMRYNCLLPMAYNEAYKDFTIRTFNDFYGCDYTDYAAMEADAVVMHFAGESKVRPWAVAGGCYANVWQRYYNASPLRDMWLRQEPAPADYPYNPTRACFVSIRLFGVLPISRWVSRAGVSRLSVCGIPLLSIKKSGIKKKWLLFGFIPLFTCRTRILG